MVKRGKKVHSILTSLTLTLKSGVTLCIMKLSLIAPSMFESSFYKDLQIWPFKSDVVKDYVRTKEMRTMRALTLYL